MVPTLKSALSSLASVLLLFFNHMNKSNITFVLVHLLLIFIVGIPLNAQYLDPQAGKDEVIPEELDYCATRMALINARTGKKLTPEQIACLGEYGFDTTNYYAKCKQLRLVRNLSTVGILSCGLGGIGLIAWTDRGQDGSVIYNKGRVIAGTSFLAIALGGMIGLDAYLKKEISILIDSADKARVKIGATDSGFGLTITLKSRKPNF